MAVLHFSLERALLLAIASAGEGRTDLGQWGSGYGWEGRTYAQRVSEETGTPLLKIVPEAGRVEGEPP
jgi:hypothetical protein